ncbi:MAG TPA: uroporphyrinogen-III C-methyltransferase [Burkholderiales bacterium]|nr:uroporphyrinogen-III C-methyltransferase [Burkholderiales bacterium]
MTGKVYLIGAGPGDPQLMTLKAARALWLADVVLIDALVNRGCLAHTRAGARVIEVGKRCGRGSASQVFIDKLLLHYSKSGNTVARLKGGDPFMFGRGGEELQKLLSAGVEVEVIPGVTAGIAVPAMLGIPVTHRGLARGVTFVTGHGAGVDWGALARSGTTLVIYMGLRNLPKICASLIAGGLKPSTPACVIENGTLPSQRQVVGTLATLSGSGFHGPALIVVGDVVQFAKKGSGPFSWKRCQVSSPDPISGKRVLTPFLGAA